MKKFIIKILLFCGLFIISASFAVGFDYFVIGNQHLGNYQASLIDKVNRLQSIDKSKIILIGNSNVCFGIDSKQIEEAFGMPVVDMGLHAGLGNAFHEDMVKLGVSEGDIVIVCHSSFDDDTILNTSLAWITIEKHKELWSLIRTKDLIPMIRAYPNYFIKSFIYWGALGSLDNIPNDKSCYSRSAFNEYGDIENRFDDRYEFNETSVSVPAISDECINRMNKLNTYIKEQGATMLVAGYPIGEGKYTPDASEFEEFEQELRTRLDCDVISNYTDYFIPYKYFYNTSLHLSEDGVDIRTKQMITDIQNWMDVN